MRHLVGLFSSRIQLSLLLHWPHLAKKTKVGEAMMQVNFVSGVGSCLGIVYSSTSSVKLLTPKFGT